MMALKAFPQQEFKKCS